MGAFYQVPSNQQGLFADISFQQAPDQLGDPLQAVQQYIDFESFRPTIETVLQQAKRKQGKDSRASRPAMDPVLMFKVLFLQRLYGLSDSQTEFMILDRNSFQRFLGIVNPKDVPDRNTIWLYRERFTKLNLMQRLFDEFHQRLLEQGMICQEGKMIDASFVVAPKQRNTRQENQLIKQGKGSELWKERPRKKCQKDIDARWTKKAGQSYYGYKAHVKADIRSKFIDAVQATPANVHDSQVVETLLDESDAGQPLYADSGYCGREQEEIISKHGMQPQVCEKGYRNKKLTEEQKVRNREMFKKRCRIEHIFGFMEGSMKGLVVRSVGIVRAAANVLITALVYNVMRYVQIKKLKLEL